MKKLFIPPVFVLISLILIILFYFIIPDYNLISFPYNLSGVLISFTGFFIMGKVQELFKKHKTNLAINVSSYMITEGVFSKTRNPMYIGMYLFLLGTGICFMNMFSILVSFGFLLIIHFAIVPTEENLMKNTFGQLYLDYMKNVRRWI